MHIGSYKRILMGSVIFLVLLVIWEYAGGRDQSVRLLISSPSLITEYFVENISTLLSAFWITFIEALAGLILATLVAFAAMIACFCRPRLIETLLPMMVVSQVIPLIVLAPFFILLLGIGISSKIAMAGLMAILPIFVNFAQGYRSIGSDIHELMFIYDAPLQYRITRIYFPLSMSSLMAGLKISGTLAVIGAIVAEFNGAEAGLGKNLFLSAKRLEPELMMASLILSTILGLVFFLAVHAFEKRFGKWYLIN